MSDDVNRQFVIAARPDGLLKESDFEYRETAVPEPADGQVLVRVLMVAVEPALRGTMVEDKDNPANLQLGDVMGALAAGQVVRSNNPDVAVGDLVQGLFGFTDYFVTHPKAFSLSDFPGAAIFFTASFRGSAAYRASKTDNFQTRSNSIASYQ